MTRRRTLWTTAAATVAACVAFGLLWFEPWKLVVDDTVNEALPPLATESPTAPAVISGAGQERMPDDTRNQSTPAQQTAQLLERGTFISHEHHTTGVVSVVRQPDGSRVLAIANLRTSNGPLLKVWLTDRTVTKDGWHVFDDGKYVNLGGLKGNIGNQVYRIPESADLSVLHSVTIWCDRFDVSFGAAELVAVR